MNTLEKKGCIEWFDPSLAQLVLVSNAVTVRQMVSLNHIENQQYRDLANKQLDNQAT
ncbi:MAG: hypothetical protein AAF703_00355 [Cyanobacteria bacterium P01_D01_bin.105]